MKGQADTIIELNLIKNSLTGLAEHSNGLRNAPLMSCSSFLFTDCSYCYCEILEIAFEYLLSDNSYA